jgi:ABC-type antimicrobial peptide transport system permease subunit
LVRERLLADVSSVLGGLAVLLAGLGLYAIVSYAVVRRRQELGIRMALGAQPAAILGLILRDSAMVVGVGILVGVLLAGLGSRWIETLLFGLPPNDVETFIVASILLLAVAFSASVIPAYRAAETDPMLVLRHE